MLNHRINKHKKYKQDKSRQKKIHQEQIDDMINSGLFYQKMIKYKQLTSKNQITTYRNQRKGRHLQYQNKQLLNLLCNFNNQSMFKSKLIKTRQNSKQLIYKNVMMNNQNIKTIRSVQWRVNQELNKSLCIRKINLNGNESLVQKKKKVNKSKSIEIQRKEQKDRCKQCNWGVYKNNRTNVIKGQDNSYWDVTGWDTY